MRAQAWARAPALRHMKQRDPSPPNTSCQAQAAAWPGCLAAEARVDCSHVSRAPTRTHPLRVGRGASDPLGVRSSRRGSGCGGVRRVPRVHCGLHRRVAPQGRRRSSQRRPVRPRRLVRGLVLDRRVDSLLRPGNGSSSRSAARAPPPGDGQLRNPASVPVPPSPTLGRGADSAARGRARGVDHAWPGGRDRYRDAWGARASVSICSRSLGR